MIELERDQVRTAIVEPDPDTDPIAAAQALANADINLPPINQGNTHEDNNPVQTSDDVDLEEYEVPNHKANQTNNTDGDGNDAHIDAEDGIDDGGGLDHDIGDDKPRQRA